MNKNKQVGYLGPEGTFSHEAVLKVVDETDEIKPYPTILNIFEDLEDNKIDMAIVPVENSTEGSVLITLDCLTNFNNIKIIQEFQIPIKHNLLIQHGKTIDEIKVICSHQQPLAQCREYIYKLKKPVQSMPSTANAARYVTEIETAAVIGNKMLADKYDLKIIDENIQDYKNNVTRFLVLKKDAKTKPTGHDKTSIIISLYDDKPGGFYKVLYEFKEENVNLTHIESRPSKEGMGKYLFFIDMEGHKLDENISRVLMKVEKKVKMFKILGSYETINC
ncbi:prephenate dehydratase [Methanosphaera cuniculi]|uniref:prephenate dehydratase n=1 Tax=Methanosphaera cuniculi TaxID=1077256 RepID=A0A2A2HFM0_9EURY|nr:prephenate dehydratase [Methanosphaera cuniculi]PAV08239.1 chorismate mutase [Methanosphaera cuniculi]PWL08327.1 prephenate dehydratase [Methanosphaera cuniculi]